MCCWCVADVFHQFKVAANTQEMTGTLHLSISHRCQRAAQVHLCVCVCVCVRARARVCIIPLPACRYLFLFTYITLSLLIHISLSLSYTCSLNSTHVLPRHNDHFPHSPTAHLRTLFNCHRTQVFTAAVCCPTVRLSPLEATMAMYTMPCWLHGVHCRSAPRTDAALACYVRTVAAVAKFALAHGWPIGHIGHIGTERCKPRLSEREHSLRCQSRNSLSDRRAASVFVQTRGSA